MKLWKILCLFGVCLWAASSYADLSYRMAHPLGQMHMLPSGDRPGWQGSFWVQLEQSHSSVWIIPTVLNDSETGDVYRYSMDYEQASTYVELGFALSTNWALMFEYQYWSQQAGNWDQEIDGFHKAIGSHRFFRNYFPENKYSRDISYNGQNSITETNKFASDNYKIFLKYWPVQWNNSFCNCGLSFAFLIKPKITTNNFNISSDEEYSLMLNYGIPIGQQDALWFSSAVTRIGDNPLLENWPTKKWHQMYELGVGLGISKSLYFVFQIRAESAFMEKRNLQYSPQLISDESEEKVASAVNGLFEWRTSQVLGLEYHASQMTRFRVFLQEDLGFGDKDDRDDLFYVTNSPDVGIHLQLRSGF